MKLQLFLGYPLILVALLEMLLGALLLRQNPRNSRVNKAVAAFSFASAAFSLSVSLMYLSSAAGRDHLLFARMAWVGWFSIPAALQVIFYIRAENSRIARMTGWVLYPFWAVALCLALFTNLIVTDHYILVPFENHPGPLEHPLRFIGGALIVWLMIEIVRLRRRVSGIKRAQLNYFFYGTLIFATLGSLSAAFLQLFGGFRFEPGLASYFSFPWVMMTFYAINRYRLFDMRLIVTNSASAVFLFFLFAWSQVVLFDLLEPVGGDIFSVLLSLLFTVMIFFGTPLSKRVRSVVERMLLQDKYVYQDVLKEAVKAVVTILDFGELLDYLTETVKRSLRAGSVALFLRNADGRFRLSHGIGGAEQLPAAQELDEEIVELVRQTGQAIVREELERILSDDSFGDLNRKLKEIGAELIIPLRYKGQLDGVLAVGGKGSGEHFIQSDIDLLEALSDHAAVAIENARLYEAAKEAHDSLRESEARLSEMAGESIRKYLSR